MESLRSIIASMDQGEYLASIDIQDAYLHIPIAPAHQRFLRFAVNQNHYQFVALPFGLATAPRTFTKVMAATMDVLHSRGILVVPYLDDLLIKSPTFKDCESSSISPVCHESPRPDGSSNRGSAICPVSPQGPSTSHTQILGQEPLLPRQGVQVDVINQEVPALVAQTNLAYTREAIPLRTMEDPDYRCKPDRLGGGAPTSQGKWSPREVTLPINVLEIRAILLALRAFHHLLAASHIRIQSDNATAVAYVNHQGGTRSAQAMREVAHILRWAEDTRSVLSAVHIPGVENWEADFLSRQGMDSGEWSLHPEIFCQICQRWRTPEVDLMASHLNTKVPNFMARTHDPRSLGADALVQDWSQFRLLYIFPPLPLIARVVRKIKQEGVPTILIAPDWPRRT
ncbi:uncharacterized protein [Dendrobates tinctorius]|uniref:uncharacterized protein n=1 Tax=Dendrobates tinctorius TaxID=92724 RepID=UPI003CC9F623